MPMAFEVLLYYFFGLVENHEDYTKRHLEFCASLGLKGRILVAPEGINGTCSGPVESTLKYREQLEQDFPGIVFKIDPSEGHVFQKLFVRARPEIISLGVPVSVEDTGGYLSPKEWREAMADPNTILLDGRNAYESDIGRFEGAICPDVNNFRDFPAWIEENLADKKDAKILSYCTGGIRCEKLTAWMKAAGFKDVWQLDGGIVTYGKDPDTKGEGFEGQCYVFDERIGVPIGPPTEEKVLTHCIECGAVSTRLVNCTNVECNVMMTLCEECAKDGDVCSEECRNAPFHRDRHGRLYRVDPTNRPGPAKRSQHVLGVRDSSLS